MPTPAEKKAISDFLFENPKNIEVAYLVYETWTSVRDEVCKEILSQIFEHIKTARLFCHCGADINFDFEYGGDKRYSNCLWLYRESWVPNEATSAVDHPRDSNRTAILLENASNGPNSWFISVRTPKTIGETEDSGIEGDGWLQEELKRVLGKSDGKPESNLPWWRYIRSDFRNWESLVPRLDQERKDPDGGEITHYFVDEFVKVATKAIPVLNKIENFET